MTSHPNVWYFAHPVGPPCACPVTHQGSTPDVHAAMVACNLARAKRWYRWCREQAPQIAIIAPWMVDVELGDDADPAQRERGISGSCAAAALCAGIILTGGRRSPGMQRELDALLRERTWKEGVLDLTQLGPEPPLEFSAKYHARLRALR